MKNLLYSLILCLSVFSCRVTQNLTEDRPNTRKTVLNISSIPMGVINFADYADTVKVVGNYFGGRVLLLNANNTFLQFSRNLMVATDEHLFTIPNGTHRLTFKGPANLRGAVKAEGKVTFLTVDGIDFSNCKYGVWASQPATSNYITVENCTFTNITKEALYLGPSKAHIGKEGTNFFVRNNRFFKILWDAIQIGNCNGFTVENNTINRAGIEKVWGQDYGVTINPNSTGSIFKLTIKNTENRIQVLESRVFFRKLKHGPEENN